MTRDEYVFYKFSILSLCLGFILGMALGLLVFCPVVHAETTGIVAEPTDRVLGSVYPISPPIRSCEVFSGQKWCRHNYDAEDIGGDDIRLSCLATMEAAMRAMDEFVDQKQKDYESYDGCNYCDSRGCTLLACPFGGNEVARLEWELKKAKETAVTATKKTIAAKQWRDAKACWRKP